MRATNSVPAARCKVWMSVSQNSAEIFRHLPNITCFLGFLGCPYFEETTRLVIVVSWSLTGLPRSQGVAVWKLSEPRHLKCKKEIKGLGFRGIIVKEKRPVKSSYKVPWAFK